MHQIDKLPNNVIFEYLGVLFPNKLTETLFEYDLFLFPTFGENFGHVIAEAIGCGLPVLISDKTPWRNLVQIKLGWDISLSESSGFVDAIEYCCTINADDYFEWKHKIHDWALKNVINDEIVDQNRNLFNNLNS